MGGARHRSVHGRWRLSLVRPAPQIVWEDCPARVWQQALKDIWLCDNRFASVVGARQPMRYPHQQVRPPAAGLCGPGQS
jgi:hypothetical protein